MELSKEDFIELVSYAHIEGQSDAGIDASWSNARAYAEGRWNKLNPDLTDRDVALRIAMDYIGAKEAREIRNNAQYHHHVYVTDVLSGEGELLPKIIVIENPINKNGFQKFLIGESNSFWNNLIPENISLEYEEVFFKDIIKGVKE